ncbi:hypothetical protein HPB50_009545 [Hyalomma asiaticum]|uniref:Uncharacterized protein n=1 Tax=Hyalomma asiaticum TaxID=266040 RepID=A0ACB7T7A0_HYAAI|nr:hypothetical protein HPB50_009545 [Hyalomma asiaticum]
MVIATRSKPASFELTSTGNRGLFGRFNQVVCSGATQKAKQSAQHSQFCNTTTPNSDERTPSEGILAIADAAGENTAERGSDAQVVLSPGSALGKKWHWAAPDTNLLTGVQTKLYSRKSSTSNSRTKKKNEPRAAGAGKGRPSNFKPVTHVLFDLDGLLLDTETIYSQAAQTLASRYGKKFTWELDKRVLGTPDADAARVIVESLGLPLTPSEFFGAVNRICEQSYEHTKLMPGAERLLRHLSAHGVPMAVATSTTPALFALKMARHQDLVPLFHHVVCSGGDTKVKRGKPHPDIFLVAASMFDEKPPPKSFLAVSLQVLVFEDSPMGVTAALAAGMQVVMVPDPRLDEENRRRATMCIASLLEFKPELFGLPPFDKPRKR